MTERFFLRRRGFVSALAAVLLFLSVPAAPAGGMEVGNHVPSLNLTDLRGETMKIGWEGDSAETTILFFFDFQGAAGVYGLTFLDSLYREAHDFGLDVLAVAVGSDRMAAAAAFERYRSVYPEPPFPVFFDDGTLRKSLGISLLPSIFAIEKHGVVYFEAPGFDSGAGDATASRIYRFLQHPAAAASGEENKIPAEFEEEPPSRQILFSGDSAPPFSTYDPGGNLHSFRFSSPDPELSIVFLWGDPCRSCIEEMLFLDQVQQRAKDIGLALRVLAVAVGGLDEIQMQGMMERYTALYPPPSFPVVVDGDEGPGLTFGWDRLPTTFFIDGQGLIIGDFNVFERRSARAWSIIIEEALPRSQGLFRAIID